MTTRTFVPSIAAMAEYANNYDYYRKAGDLAKEYGFRMKSVKNYTEARDYANYMRFVRIGINPVELEIADGYGSRNPKGIVMRKNAMNALLDKAEALGFEGI